MPWTYQKTKIEDVEDDAGVDESTMYTRIK